MVGVVSPELSLNYVDVMVSPVLGKEASLVELQLFVYGINLKQWFSSKGEAAKAAPDVPISKPLKEAKSEASRANANSQNASMLVFRKTMLEALS